MIGFLRGVLLHKTPQELLIDVGGVGYKVQAPISTFCRLGDQGAQAQLLIHTHVREDQLVLYGFLTNTELELFEKLISVSGVGPKVALGVLSGIEADDLVHAIRANDVARLTRVPGVGKKNRRASDPRAEGQNRHPAHHHCRADSPLAPTQRSSLRPAKPRLFPRRGGPRRHRGAPPPA